MALILPFPDLILHPLCLSIFQRNLSFSKIENSSKNSSLSNGILLTSIFLAT